MGYRMPSLNQKLWVGDSQMDVTLSTAILPATNEYRNVTIPAGVTLTVPTTEKGPLIIRASGIIDVAGTITAKGKSFDSSGGGGYESGRGGFVGPGAVFPLETMALPTQWYRVYPVPAGSGGKGAISNGFAGYISRAFGWPSAASWYGLPYRAMYLSAKWVSYSIPGGTTGGGNDGAWGVINTAGAGGSDDYSQIGTFDMSSIVHPERNEFVLGAGGGAGGRNSDGDVASGGAGGGIICLIAPVVRLRAGCVLDVRGNDGSAAVAGKNGGGGGGGAGGSVGILCRTIILDGAKNISPSAAAGVIAASYNVYLQGGVGGSGAGTGFAGGAGYGGGFAIRQLL